MKDKVMKKNKFSDFINILNDFVKKIKSNKWNCEYYCIFLPTRAIYTVHKIIIL